MLTEAIPSLHGTVFPPPTDHARVSVELRQGHALQAVSSASLSAGGVFAVALPGVGVYRVPYRHTVTPRDGATTAGLRRRGDPAATVRLAQPPEAVDDALRDREHER
jgi:hypothetical protein